MFHIIEKYFQDLIVIVFENTFIINHFIKFIDTSATTFSDLPVLILHLFDVKVNKLFGKLVN